MRSSAKRVAVVGMLCALSYLLVAVVRIPVVSFLSYEPKDIIITFSGFVFGPLYALLISVIVSFVEMITISDTSIIGFFMNFLSSAAFSVPAAIMYRRKHSLRNAVSGLILGCISMCAVMLLWNWLITPIYWNISRAEVTPMLLTVFLPFNLLKSAVNASLTLLIYKPAVSALRAAHLLPRRENALPVISKEVGGTVAARPARINFTVALSALAVFITCVLIVLAWRGII